MVELKLEESHGNSFSLKSHNHKFMLIAKIKRTVTKQILNAHCDLIMKVIVFLLCNLVFSTTIGLIF
jgi:hypothetical protein